jgi:gliding motility associated protien GldN
MKKVFLLSGLLTLVSIGWSNAQNGVPLDDVTEKSLVATHPMLSYPHTDERDVLWEKRIWELIDIRTLKNQPFRYPPRPFIQILVDEIMNGNIRAYSTEDDKFSKELSPDEISELLASRDTVLTFDPETYEEQIQVVTNDLNPEDVYLYRLKEIWWVDSKYSQLKVRILGIAPIIEVTDDNGNFKYYKPLFWIYYPDARKVLARHRVFNPWNDACTLTWEDWLEMRFFDSVIIKESNVHDRRIEDYATGIDALLEGQKIKDEIFNFEQDLWSY